jgi:hypothetical protein
LVLCVLAACGRSGLDADLAAVGPSDTIDDAARGNDGGDAAMRSDAPEQDAGATVDVGLAADAYCPFLPAPGPQCPPVAPADGEQCVPPKGDAAACAYAEARAEGTVVDVFTCRGGEDLIAWRHWEMPCTEACVADALDRDADAGGAPIAGGPCASRQVVDCAPGPGETVQDLLNGQVLANGCVHHEGAGGFTVFFDPEGCAVLVTGGIYSACDVDALGRLRFACAAERRCAVAPALVR